jgi:hypothetical protein
VAGYEARNVVIEIDRRRPAHPRVYVDGPVESPHRHYGERGGRVLCLWHPADAASRRWIPEDGLLNLLGMISEHLFKEAWWREHHEWLGEEYPH